MSGEVKVLRVYFTGAPLVFLELDILRNPHAGLPSSELSRRLLETDDKRN